MTISLPDSNIIDDIQYNCNISDARDHGIYSMCTMILKLRNLYKWEHDLEPWQEAEPADLLDWIDTKEHYWQAIAENSYRQLRVNGSSYSPDSLDDINRAIAEDRLVYGAGHGRSMKAVFFLAEKLKEYEVADCPVIVLGREVAKEMASPFAMAQEGRIYIRKYSLRYFLWDQIQELRSSCRSGLHQSLKIHGLIRDDNLDQERFKEKLDTVVDEELNFFIYHEVGELLQTTLDSAVMEKILTKYPGSVVELVCRTVKDLLADTHPSGLLTYIIREERESSLGFYLGFLDGLRKELFPEIAGAWTSFCESGNWQHIAKARTQCRQKTLKLAETIVDISAKIEKEPDETVLQMFNKRLLVPLGLDIAD